MRNIAVNQDPAVEAIETREWQDSLDYVLQQGGGVARAAESASRNRTARPPDRSPPPVYGRTRPTSTRSRRRQQPAFPATRAIERRIKSLVRWNALRDGGPREQARVTASAATSRRLPRLATLYEIGFNHFFTRQGQRRRRRRHLLPGPRRARHLRPRVRRGPAVGRQQLENFRRELQHGRRPLVLPAPVADARLLGVPDGVDGPRPDHVDLPGALHPLPGGSRPEAAADAQGAGRSSATARPTSRNRSARSRSRRARSSTT